MKVRARWVAGIIVALLGTGNVTLPALIGAATFTSIDIPGASFSTAIGINARGDIVDRYTHVEWTPLCEAMNKLNFDAHQDPHQGPGNPQNSGGGPSWLGKRIAADSCNLAASTHTSIPRASRTSRPTYSSSS